MVEITSQSYPRGKHRLYILATSMGLLVLSTLVFYIFIVDPDSRELGHLIPSFIQIHEHVLKRQQQKTGFEKSDSGRNEKHSSSFKARPPEPPSDLGNENHSSLSSSLSASSSSATSFIELINSKAEIHQFNRHKLLPLIKSLVTMDYFRYVKINLDRPCKLWCNSDKCSMRDCKVKTLSDPSKCPVATYDDELSTVNTELASDQLDLLIKLFECNDNDDHDSQYVDLLINPERYTGYSGESAHRVWRAIYEENCFVKKSRSPFSDDLCYEERLFYESISGLHSSINIHLSAEYPSNAIIGSFEPNLNEFLRRFEDHNDYLSNLYTLYLLELRALAASKTYLLKYVNWPDQSIKRAIQDLLTVVDKLEIPMFDDLSLKPSHVSHELAIHFRNITTTIIDCVACDKCKLWGRVQLRGLGTAFKILSVKDIAKLHLNHQEIVSLINAIARLSHSIRQLEEFKQLHVKSSKRILTNSYKSNECSKNSKNFFR